jgi:hypothetical protein
MSKRRNANLLEVLICQITQDSEINVVLGKPLNVLLHTKLFEPVRNLLHRSPPELTLVGSKTRRTLMFAQRANDRAAWER